MRLLLYERELSDELIRRIRRSADFHIAQALITSKGLEKVQRAICASLDRGGKGRVLVGVDMPTEPAAIEMLLRIQEKYSGRLDLKFFKSSERRMFHAKFAVFKDRQGQGTAILGSSNLTLGGMAWNYEANALLSDQKAVDRLLDYFEEHYSGGHARKVTGDWLRDYQLYWKEREKALARLRTLRSKVRRIGTKPESGRPPPKRIKDHVFAFTGMIAGWPRESALYPEVIRLGGRIALSADGMGKAECLVHGEILGGKKSTRKLKRARELEIPVITEDEFFRLKKREQSLRAR